MKTVIFACVTMGCDDWPTDPKGRSMAEVRRIREEIRERVKALVAAKRWKGPVG